MSLYQKITKRLAMANKATYRNLRRSSLNTNGNETIGRTASNRGFHEEKDRFKMLQNKVNKSLLSHLTTANKIKERNYKKLNKDPSQKKIQSAKEYKYKSRINKISNIPDFDHSEALNVKNYDSRSYMGAQKNQNSMSVLPRSKLSPFRMSNKSKDWPAHFLIQNNTITNKSNKIFRKHLQNPVSKEELFIDLVQGDSQERPK